MSNSGNTLAKVAIFITSLLAVVGIVIVAVMLGQSREIRDTNPKLAGAVSYGSAYVLPADASAVAVGVTLESGTLEPQDTKNPGKYNAQNVVQLFSKDPTKTTVSYGDKVRVFFPLAGLWFTSNNASQYLTDSFDAATEVTVAPAAAANPAAPTSGPVQTGYPVQLFESAADPSDAAFKTLSQGSTVHVVPAAVFGAAGLAGA